MHPCVKRLAELVLAHGWARSFQLALDRVAAQDVPELSHVCSFEDYLRYIDQLVRWSPRESGDSRLVHDKLVEFYFVLDQEPLKSLQSPIQPGSASDVLTPLSQWIVDFARAWGSYLDHPESAAHVDSFRTDPAFQWDDYMPPPSGYRTFNQFFARHVKPGRRPVAGLNDPSVIVSPVDASFMGQWPIAADSTIDVKGMRWSIEELLRDSDHAACFAGGTFTHSALRTYDYHRFHSPVAGRVLEARIIQGQAYLGVERRGTPPTGAGPQHSLHAVEGTGYQFVQTRGLLVLESEIGRVACLPVGMAQVSSVVLSAETGAVLRKGEELGYFQFGGSDFVLVFEQDSAVRIDCAPDAHHLQGEAIGLGSAR